MTETTLTREDVDALLKRVEAFVADVTVGRDATHGVEHMVEVTTSAAQLLADASAAHELADDSEQFRLLVLAAALLHDVCDHKYDKENGTWALVALSCFLALTFLSKKTVLKGKVDEFLQSEPLLVTLSDEIAWIIDNVSYSREVKTGGAELAAAAGTRKALARDFVSDAGLFLSLALSRSLILTNFFGKQRRLLHFFDRQNGGYWRAWRLALCRVSVCERKQNS